MRTISLVSVSLLALACSDPEPADSAGSIHSTTPHSERSSPQVAAIVPAGAVEEPGPPSRPSEPAPVVQAAEPSDLPPSAQSIPIDADPLAPILPSGPEPGSPESDAELAELLDESTLTQEEFDAAFRGSKPNIEGDQLVFGPGDRTRKAPVVTIGTPTISNSKVAASELAKLAKAHQRGFEGCLAVALTEDPTTRGSLTLKLEFDGAGETSKITVDGGAALGAPLRECLAAVADDWKLASAAKASVGIPLGLASE